MKSSSVTMVNAASNHANVLANLKIDSSSQRQPTRTDAT
jgi:hypothetical protein